MGAAWLSDLGLNYPAYGVVHSGNALSAIWSDTDSRGNEAIYIRTVWEPTPGVMHVFDAQNHPDLIAETYF